jgi:hypothetical protein
MRSKRWRAFCVDKTQVRMHVSVRHPEGENLLGKPPEHKQPSDFGCVLSPAQGEENNKLYTERNLIPSTPIDNKHYAIYYRTSNLYNRVANHSAKLHQ